MQELLPATLTPGLYNGIRVLHDEQASAHATSVANSLSMQKTYHGQSRQNPFVSQAGSQTSAPTEASSKPHDSSENERDNPTRPSSRRTVERVGVSTSAATFRWQSLYSRKPPVPEFSLEASGQRRKFCLMQAINQQDSCPW